MCGVIDSEIKAARAEPEMTNALCPDCQKPLAGHMTAEESGYQFLHGFDKRKIEAGDHLLLFDNDTEAALFSSRPFYHKPGQGFRSRTVIPAGFVGKTLTEFCTSSGMYSTDFKKIVVMRPIPSMKQVNKKLETADKIVPAP